jgi:uncharacterized protein (DUF1697 family)
MADVLIALLRGVNVGRANRVAMADLRALLASLGYLQARTLLNSGNAVFSAPTGSVPEEAAGRIETALAAQLDVRAHVVCFAASALATAIEENPLGDVADDPSRLLVAFLSDPANRRLLAEVAAREWAPEAIALGERVAYLWCPGGVAQSPLSSAVGQALGDGATARNWTTVVRLQALAQDQTERTDRVVVENVVHPGRTRTVDGVMYRAAREALLRVLPSESPGLTLEQAIEAYVPHLPESLFPGGAKAGWWFKTVQLDLEAKGIIVREPVSPLRVHLASKS